MRVSIPGTARNAITVGAYVTKDEWTDVNGTPRRCTGILSASTCAPDVGDLAAFSSNGPTRDGRQKPEIVAPGQMIASTYSSDAPSGSLFSMFPSDEWIVEDGRHGVSMGTSFAAPHVTGAVALLLEVDPSLDANRIRDLLTSAARRDDFARGLPNDEWGYGKLDVYAALQQVVPPPSPTPTATQTPTPTPTQTQTPTPTVPATSARVGIVYLPLVLRNLVGVVPPPTATPTPTATATSSPSPPPTVTSEPPTRTPTLSLTPTPATTATPTPTYTATPSTGLTIFGAVQACTGERVAGATVTLEGTGESTQTDAEGRYTLGPLTDFLPGSYVLTASKPGYEPR